MSHGVRITLSTRVALYMSAWIEITRKAVCCLLLLVTLYISARIEISSP